MCLESAEKVEAPCRSAGELDVWNCNKYSAARLQGKRFIQGKLALQAGWSYKQIFD